MASQCSQCFSLINYSKHPKILNSNLPDNREPSRSVYSSNHSAQQYPIQMSLSGGLWPPQNCHTSLFCTEDVKNKLVQLFCCYLRKAYPTFCSANFTCRSMFVSLFLRNCQKDRIPQFFWEFKDMYFSFMKCFSFLLGFHFLASKEGHSYILWSVTPDSI